MRLFTVIEGYIPDVKFKLFLIYCPIITNTFHYVVGIYLPVTENTSTVIEFLLSSLILPKTVPTAHLLQVLGNDPTQITILNPNNLSVISI